MDGYERSSYGDAFADVYDDWYRGVTDVAATVSTLAELAAGGPVLELGVGTGRLAIPLAATGVAVHGVDASDAMLQRLRSKDPEATVAITLGDMVDDLPRGPFSLAVTAYNTLFNLTDEARQEECFCAVAERLAPGGRFVVEAFVPEDPPREGDRVSIRSLTADRVVLSVSMHHAAEQKAEGQFVELSEAGGVRLRPWCIRYSTPSELDGMAGRAGLALEHRWEDFTQRGFDDRSERHVSVYRASRNP